jgi:hypothetical protein
MSSSSEEEVPFVATPYSFLFAAFDASDPGNANLLLIKKRHINEVDNTDDITAVTSEEDSIPTESTMPHMPGDDTSNTGDEEEIALVPIVDHITDTFQQHHYATTPPAANFPVPTPVVQTSTTTTTTDTTDNGQGLSSKKSIWMIYMHSLVIIGAIIYSWLRWSS